MRGELAAPDCNAYRGNRIGAADGIKVQWEKLQDDERTAYIAGLIDSLETMAATEPAQRTARHYTECLMRSRLTAGQLADFLREYVRARPEMQGSYVQRAINDYLNALCGRSLD